MSLIINWLRIFCHASHGAFGYVAFVVFVVILARCLDQTDGGPRQAQRQPPRPRMAQVRRHARQPNLLLGSGFQLMGAMDGLDGRPEVPMAAGLDLDGDGIMHARDAEANSEALGLPPTTTLSFMPGERYRGAFIHALSADIASACGTCVDSP